MGTTIVLVDYDTTLMYLVQLTEAQTIKALTTSSTTMFAW